LAARKIKAAAIGDRGFFYYLAVEKNTKGGRVAVFAYRDHRISAGSRYARKECGLLDHLFQRPIIFLD
jgi:hypothetical protein